MGCWPKLLNTMLKSMALFGAVILTASAMGPLTQPVHADQNAQGPMDLMLVIDNSGSMKKNDPQFNTRQALKSFVAQLPEQSRVGMVLFDENVRLLHRLRIISSPRVQEQFLGSLEKIDYNGRYTNSPGGIERALYELKTNGRIDSHKAIVFLTDGIVTTGSKSKNRDQAQWLKQDLTRELKQLNIRIYGIAFTEAADFSLIQTLASRTEGEYFRADDAAQITTAFDRIRSHLNAIRTQTPTIKPMPMLPEAATDNPEQQSQNISDTDKSVVVVSHNTWLYFWLALITIILSAVVILFFTRQQHPKPYADPMALPLAQLPEAQLADLNNACKGSATFDLDKALVTIGRGEPNDIRIPQTTISKHHATIEYKHLAFYLTDLKSTNGTRLNGEPLKAHEPVRLKNSDLISFGKFQFQLEIPEQIQFNETVMLSRTSLNDPEDQATIMVDLDETSGQDALVTCLQHHLMQIEALGPKFKAFTRRHFSYDTLKALATDGDQNLKRSRDDHQLHHTTWVQDKLFYLVCSLPVETHHAANWYGSAHGGFTQFVLQWVKSDAYLSAQCEAMCIVTFGQIPTHWVSLTIVPTHGEPDPVEIISVDFLGPEERSALSLETDDPEGSSN